MVKTNLSSIVKLKSDVLFRQVNNETVIINLDNSNYFALNQVGSRMVQALTESVSVEEAYKLLKDEYEVMPETLLADLLELVENLYQHDLITLD